MFQISWICVRVVVCLFFSLSVLFPKISLFYYPVIRSTTRWRGVRCEPTLCNLNPLRLGRVVNSSLMVLDARHDENERSLKSNLSLCNETLHMVAYLTSDPDIQKVCMVLRAVDAEISYFPLPLSGSTVSFRRKNQKSSIFPTCLIFIFRTGVTESHARNAIAPPRRFTPPKLHRPFP